MATVNYIPYQRQSAVSLGKVAGYVSQDEKTQDRRTGRKLVSGVRCSSHFAVQEFRATRTAHHKKSPVWFYHYTQSFSPKEPITGPQAHQLAKEFAEQAWPESQVLVATHVDARHIHSHFLVNAVCYESGKMLRQGPRTLEHLRDLSDQLCMKYHYSVLPRERPKQGKEPSTREYRSMEKGQSWKLHLMVAIEDCMASARSRQDFIRRMKRRGYGVRWEDGRKYITYTTPGGMRCRDNKLHEMKFRKEKMEYELRIRAEILRRLEAAGPAAVPSRWESGALRHRDGEELGGAFIAAADPGSTAGTGFGSPGHPGYPVADGGIPPEPDGGTDGLRPEVPGSLTEFPELLEGVGEGGGEEAIHTGWEDQRSIFLEAVLQPGESGQSRQGTVLDLPDSHGLAGSLGSDAAYLSADLTQLLEATPEVEDSTTMRPQRRRKRALGEKPDEQDYQQKM